MSQPLYKTPYTVPVTEIVEILNCHGIMEGSDPKEEEELE